MTVAPGERFGSYEIVAKIGAGGMGEVYRAHDAKLRRDVALKVLPASLAADPERRQRLLREAHILASLNHPAIACIYDLVETDVLALVLELVEGPTLAERIAAGPVPVNTAIDIAGQIVEALDAAHERGIVHRDLKPANIKLAADDRVKVLDFGLAKAFAAGSDVDVAASPTISDMRSQPGVILGTAPYMSPEQARGKPLDKRVDIWAFGCVLFEMLTGQRTFLGDDLTEIVVAIMTKEPDWALLPLHTPPRVVELLKQCLKRPLRDRLRDIGDARRDIEAATSAPQRVPVSPLQRRLSPPVHFQRLTDFVGINGSPAISPDGKMVAFVAASGRRKQVWVRLLTGGTSLQLTRDDADHEQPRWAPDSSSLIYYTAADEPGASGTICEVSAFGGTPRPITAALGGGDISHDGRRIAAFQSIDDHVELAMISRDGATVELVRPLPATLISECPRWSPDDRYLAFHGHVVPYFDQRIFIVPINGGSHRDVVRGAILRGLAWLPDGRGLVYSSPAGGGLPYPPTFSLRTIDIDATEDRQLTFGDASYVEPDVHRSGRLLASRIRGQADIWRFPLSGTPGDNTRAAVRVTRQAGRVQTPSISPDGSEVVYLSDSGGHANLWVTKVETGETRQITFNQDSRHAIGVPVWSPAGDRIAFLRTRDGDAQLWTVKPDGSGLRQMPTGGFYACWSTDGQWLYFCPPRDRPWRIVKTPIAGGNALDVRSDNAVGPAVAADGTLYYASMVNPGLGYVDLEICAARPEQSNRRVLARIAGARIPLSPPFIHMFLSPDGELLAIPLTDGSATNLWLLSTRDGSMKPATDFGERSVMISRRIAWAPDGQSLYAAVEESDADVISLTGLLE